ncbi:diguanylate cyclase [Colwelliaceae bacterium 6471]
MIKNNRLKIKNKFENSDVVSQFAIDLLPINTVDNVVWHLAKDVVAQLGFEDVVIYLKDSNKNVLYQCAAYGNKNPENYEILDPIEINVGEGVVGQVALTQRPLRIANTATLDNYIVDDMKRLSELAVPMIVEDKLIGVIDSEHHQENFFKIYHQHTLEAIASIAAIKIAQIQTVEQLKNSIKKLEHSQKLQDTLFDIAELIFETSSLHHFYQRLHQCIGNIMFSKNFFIALVTEDKKSLTLPYCVDELDDVPNDELIPIDMNRPTITGYVLKTNKALLVSENDIQQMIDSDQIYIRGSIPKAWLGVPFGDGELKGVVVVQSYNNKYIFNNEDKQILSYVAKHIRNAIERMKAKADLEFLALHDPLTKLPNRRLFTNKITQAIIHAQKTPKAGLAVFFIDLDRFKEVNDKYGHLVGDKLLVNVSDVIKNCIRNSDTLCRLGGDEFAILLERIVAKSEAQKIALKIINNVRDIKQVDQLCIDISASIGVRYFIEGGITADTLVLQADKAMYKAKLAGKNQVIYFDENSIE